MSFPYRSPPMDHQRSALKKAWKKRDYGLFWEMGTGKTYATINLAAARFLAGKVNGLLIICPTPIKLVWESELDKWCPCDFDVKVLKAGKQSQDECIRFIGKGADYGKLKVLIIGIEALSQGKAHEVARKFAVTRDTMVVCDESSRLKNPKAARTKRAIMVSNAAAYSMVLSGTPITQGIEDLFSQMQFLDPDILGTKSFVHFKRKYCQIERVVLSNIVFDKIVGYQNLDDLFDRIKDYVDIVKKEDVLDLPPKTYQTIRVEPTDEQLALISDLKNTYEAEHDGETLFAETVLERLTRFQQIIGGHFPYDLEDGGHDVKPLKGKNPKLEALMEILDEIGNDTKVIIWTRFKAESALIGRSISKQFGEHALATFTGADDYEARKTSVDRFMNGRARFMISSPQLGGMGQTWTAATLVIYYSNSFSFEDRKQSEDRAHRKGQDKPVTYIDIEANHHYDKMILNAIKTKQDVALMFDTGIKSRISTSLDAMLS